MQDGTGILADGTRYERQSGEERGINGYWHRWTRLAGVSAQGKARHYPLASILVFRDLNSLDEKAVQIS